MADEDNSNGVAVDPDQLENANKMEELEHEKNELMSENAEAKARTTEIEGLKAAEARLKEKVVQSREANKASEAIPKRAVDLETDVSTLRKELLSAMNDSQDMSAEVKRLKNVLGENEKRTENLEKEVEFLNQAKAESEDKVKELEQKIGFLEAAKKEKIDEKEKEITALIKKVDDLEVLLAKKVAETENLIKERLNLEVHLSNWIVKEKLLESRLDQLEEQVSFSVSKVKLGQSDLNKRAMNGNKVRVRGEAEEGLERQVEFLNHAKAESENKVKELEQKIGFRDATRKEKIDEKEKEITALTKKVEVLEDLLTKKLAETEHLIKERLNLEDHLTNWIDKEKLLESRMNELEGHVSSTISKMKLAHSGFMKGALNGNNAKG